MAGSTLEKSSFRASLTPSQLATLTSQENLDAMAAKSLKERVAFFKNKLGLPRLTVYHLRKLYREFGIKFKQIKLEKKASNKAPNVARGEVIRSRAEVEKAVDEGY